MSYILDALRKADAQRERDPARGIHAQPVQPALLDRSAAGRSRIWLWSVVAVGAASLAVAAWQLAGPAQAPVTAAKQPASPVVSGLVTPPAPAVPAPAVLPAPPPPTPVAVSPAVREAPKAAPRAAASAPAVQPAESDRILPGRELPSDLPKLAITGGVYSENPAQRMLIVNGQVVNEGAVLAPDVVLEQIRAKTAVLKVRGYRYSVAY